MPVLACELCDTVLDVVGGGKEMRLRRSGRKVSHRSRVALRHCDVVMGVGGGEKVGRKLPHEASACLSVLAVTCLWMMWSWRMVGLWGKGSKGMSHPNQVFSASRRPMSLKYSHCFASRILLPSFYINI